MIEDEDNPLEDATIVLTKRPQQLLQIFFSDFAICNADALEDFDDVILHTGTENDGEIQVHLDILSIEDVHMIGKNIVCFTDQDGGVYYLKRQQSVFARSRTDIADMTKGYLK